MAVEAKTVPVVTNLTTLPVKQIKQQLTPTFNQTFKIEQRPPSKPPIYLTPDKKYYVPVKHFYKPPPPRHVYTKEPLKVTNGIYQFPGVLHYNVKPPGPQTQHYYNKPTPHPQPQPLVYAATTGKPLTVPKAPIKISIPVQTVNGIRTDYIKPPYINIYNYTTTTFAPSTTKRLLRTKRIWPKRILEKMNNTVANKTSSIDTNTISNSSDFDRVGSSSSHQRVFAYGDKSVTQSTKSLESTTKGYIRVTRASKNRTTTTQATVEHIGANEWVPIRPSHFAKVKKPATYRRKRSVDAYFDNQADDYFSNNYASNLYKDNELDIFYKYQQPKNNYQSRRPGRAYGNQRPTSIFVNPSDSYVSHNRPIVEFTDEQPEPNQIKNPLYLHTYRLIPVKESLRSSKPAIPQTNAMIFGKKKRPTTVTHAPQFDLSELQAEASSKSKESRRI